MAYAGMMTAVHGFASEQFIMCGTGSVQKYCSKATVSSSVSPIPSRNLQLNICDQQVEPQELLHSMQRLSNHLTV